MRAKPPQSAGGTTQAQRPGPRDAWIATTTLTPDSLQRIVRPRLSHLNKSGARRTKSATTNSVGKSNNTLRQRITVLPRRNVWMKQRSATVVRTSAVIRTLAYRWLASVTVWKKRATSKSGTPNPNHKPIDGLLVSDLLIDIFPLISPSTSSPPSVKTASPTCISYRAIVHAL
jgi:hypothetical protein